LFLNDLKDVYTLLQTGFFGGGDPD